MQSGEYCATWLGPELPGDQRRDDALSMSYSSEPLEEDYAIVSAPKVCLTLSSNKAQAQIAVRLNQIHPDGASTRITYGVLNLSHYIMQGLANNDLDPRLERVCHAHKCKLSIMQKHHAGKTELRNCLGILNVCEGAFQSNHDDVRVPCPIYYSLKRAC